MDEASPINLNPVESPHRRPLHTYPRPYYVQEHVQYPVYYYTNAGMVYGVPPYGQAAVRNPNAVMAGQRHPDRCASPVYPQTNQTFPHRRTDLRPQEGRRVSPPSTRRLHAVRSELPDHGPVSGGIRGLQTRQSPFSAEGTPFSLRNEAIERRQAVRPSNSSHREDLVDPRRPTVNPSPAEYNIDRPAPQPVVCDKGVRNSAAPVSRGASSETPLEDFSNVIANLFSAFAKIVTGQTGYRPSSPRRKNQVTRVTRQNVTTIPHSLPPPRVHRSCESRRKSSLDWESNTVGIESPPLRKTEEIVFVPLLPQQKVYYKALLEIAKEGIRQAEDVSHASRWLSNLRLAANSIELLTASMKRMLDSRINGSEEKNRSAVQWLMAEAEERETCSICIDGDVDTITQCEHCFHLECVQSWLRTNHTTCPMCREPLTPRQLRVYHSPENILTKVGDVGKSTLLRFEKNVVTDVFSNKLTKALEIVYHELKGISPEGVPPKFLILSAFRPMLIALSNLLQVAHIPFFWLVTSMRREEVAASIKSFQTTEEPCVMLAMPRASSRKIDLSCADHVLFLDPWKDSLMDLVTTSMIWRAEQSRDVHVIKLVSSATIEEEVLEKSQNDPDGDDGTTETMASQIILQSTRYGA